MKRARTLGILGLVLAIYAAGAAVWFLSFPLKDSFNRSDLFWEGSYLLVALASYAVILRLGLLPLLVGWPIFAAGLLIDFLDEFTLDKDFFNDPIEDALNIFGLALVALGFYSAYRRRTEELEVLHETGRRLELERGRLAATLRSIGEGVIATDAAGRVTEASDTACALLGRKREDLRGQPLAAAAEWLDEAEGQIDLVARIRADDDAFARPRELRLRRPDRSGREIEVELAGQPIRFAGERTGGVILAFRDVGERRRLEREALKAGKLESLGLLAGGVAHDFNNILSAIMSWSEIPAQEGLDPAEEIREACRRGKRLSNQLMGLAKGGEPVRAPFDLAAMVREEAQFALRGSASSLALALPEEAVVDGDAGQLGQVVHNLVLNAAQAMPVGGEVRVGLEPPGPRAAAGLRPGRYLRLIVHDSGEAIPADHLDRIFDPYFTTKSSGHGLGLATSFSIVERHGGRIQVRSAPGEGTTFEVLLPAADGPAPAAAGTEDLRVPAGIRLLLVDDEEPIRRSLARGLGALGFEVRTAAAGEEALELWRRARDRGEPFAAVVLDLTMPGGPGGEEVMRRMLADDPATVGVVASGYADTPVMARHREHGFRGLITKPYT
ncbi:MAG: hybrid sensor histidine kinase/response regulator, partial [Planctomycetota bacterium]